MGEVRGFPTHRFPVLALLVFFAANALNYLDRFIISALLPDIKEALHLEDDQAGGLVTAFVLGYMVSAPIVGALSDRFSRTRLFAVAILIWSAATVMTGFAQTYSEMITYRVFIGVGEAGCLAIGPALVSDLFEPHRRGRALSFFFLGMPVGGVAGFMAGGFFEPVIGWQQTFVLAGAPGFLLALVLLVMRDAPRGAHETVTGIGVRIRGFRPYLELLKNRTLRYIILGQAAATFAIVPLVHFSVDFFEGVRGWDKQAVTIMIGLSLMTGGILGNMTSGFLGDRMARRHAGAYAGIAARGFLYGLPFLWAALAAPGPVVAGLCLGLVMFCYFACMPAVNAQIAAVTSPAQRSMAFALTVFIMHLLGDAISPPLFGVVSEQSSQGNAVAIFPVLLIPSAFLCYLARRAAEQDAERMKEQTRKLETLPR